jgi:hypothetical protein
MTASEIFGRINAHQIEGVMLHSQLAEYFGFLNLCGYQCQQEFQAMSEFSEHQNTVLYFVSRFNHLLPEAKAKDPEIIPDAWRGYARQQVDAGTKRKAVRDAFLRWRSWETETKKLYEQAYADLHELGEVAAACEVKKLVKSVACELERVESQQITLECLDYDLAAIYADQDRSLARYYPHFGAVTD